MRKASSSVLLSTSAVMSESMDGAALQKDSPPPHNISEIEKNIYDGTLNDEEDDQEEKARVDAYQARGFFRRYFLEWILFLYTIATMLYIVPLGTLMSLKLCVYKYGYDEDLCEHLETANASIKNPILDESQIYGFVNDVAINVPGALAALISGNYLTRYGFRAPIMFTLCGAMVSCMCQLATAIHMPAPVYLNALAELPGSISGGAVLMLTATYTYVALRVPHSLHLTRIMLVTLFSGIGVLIAALSGGALASWIGMKSLAISCAVLLAVIIVLVWVFLEEIDVPEENKHDSWRDAIWLSTKTGFSTAFAVIKEVRPQRKRTQIISLLICFFCAFFGLAASNGSYAFAYARSVLEFDQTKYGILNGIGFGLVFVFVYPCLWISQKLKLTHATVIAVGSFFFTLRFAMLTLTEFFNLLFYLQLLVGIPYFASLVSIRAYITDILEVSEVPVVMALLAAIEKIVPVISGIVSTVVYHFTNSSFPGAVYLIMTVNYLISMALGIYCRFILKNNKIKNQQKNPA